ncbi:MAG TPA: AraC family ligand binding domain-containing protein, partial [Tepidisphaeraceae bacterium]
MTPRRFHFVANDLAGSPLGRVLRSASIENNQGTSANTGMRHFDHYALVYLLSGRGEYRDANAVIRTIGAGDLLVLFPGLPHAYFPPRGEAWNEFNIVFDGAVFDLWRQQGLLDPSAPVLH